MDNPHAASRVKYALKRDVIARTLKTETTHISIDRRTFLAGSAASAGSFDMQFGHAPTAWAAAAVRIGVIIPGSKSDHGRMESGYNGVKAANRDWRSWLTASSATPSFRRRARAC